MDHLKTNKILLAALTIILANSQLNAISFNAISSLFNSKTVKICSNISPKSFLSYKTAIFTILGISGITALYYILREKDLNKEDKRGFTPLTMACYNGNLDEVKRILNHPKFDKAFNFNNGTALNMACSHGHIEIVKELLKQDGININQKDFIGNYPLEQACLFGHIEVVKELLKHPDIDVNKTKFLGGTPLIIACCRNDTDMAKELLKINSLDVNKVDRFDCNALYYACLNKNIKIMTLLLNKGANVAILPDNRKIEYHQNLNKLFEEIKKYREEKQLSV